MKDYNEFDLTPKERRRIERSQMKDLHGMAKVSHIWKYYKIQILLVIAAVLIVVFGVHQLLDNRYHDILYVGVVEDSSVDTETMETDLKEYLGSESRFETVTVDNALTFTEEGENVYEENVRLLTYSAIGEIDVVICSRECFEALGSEYFETESAVELAPDNAFLQKYGIDISDEMVACEVQGLSNQENADRFLKLISDK